MIEKSSLRSLRHITRIALLTFLLVGCASQTSESTIPTAAPGLKRARVLPQTIGHSVLGRPIEMYSFGAVEGGRPVLVMGAIHGNEQTSADVSGGLLEELLADPRARAAGVGAARGAGGVPVAIIPVANPDGLAAGTRGNANKIDVNRNFPSRNFYERTPGRTFRGGEKPASEPETTALMAVINRLRPRLIITVHSISDGKQCNNYDGPAREVAEVMTKHNGYPTVPTIGYPTPGSLGNWGGNDRQIPMITLELPRSLPAPRAWPDNRSAVYAAIEAVK